MNRTEASEPDGGEKEGEPAHGERDSAGNIYQRDVGEYVSEKMFAYLNELVYRDEGNHKPKNGLSIPPDFLEGKGGIIKQGVPFFTTEGGPEPTKFKAQHTCLPVNLDEFLPAASSAGAGVKPVKLRLPLAKAISKLTGAINEAKAVITIDKEVKDSTNDRKTNIAIPIPKSKKVPVKASSTNYDTIYEIHRGEGPYFINGNLIKKGDTTGYRITKDDTLIRAGHNQSKISIK
jgi:hypothetical protein